MRRFNVTVNGVSYDVVVEEVGAGNAPVAAPVAAAPVAAPAAAPVAAPAAPVAAGNNVVKAPVSGTVVKIAVTVGQTVKKGDIICVVEALKMENEVPSPFDGVVASVNVQVGASVQDDTVLVTLN